MKGLFPDQADELPYIWFIGFPRIHQYVQITALLPQQHVVRAGIQTGLFGRPPLTLEDFVSGGKSSTQPQGEPRRPLENFPYDFTLLDERSIRAAQKAGQKIQQHGHENPWPPERVQAALSDNIVAARAAQDIELWGRYWAYIQQGAEIPVAVLKKWATEIFYMRALVPTGIFKDQITRLNLHREAEGLPPLDVEQEWYAKLNRQQPGIVTQMEQSLEESLRTPLPELTIKHEA